jgi:hypothetical protein
VVQVKFRNQTQSSPDRTSGTPSSLAPLYSIDTFVADNSGWELPIDFSFFYWYDEVHSQINFDRMVFNGEVLDLSGYSADWDVERSSFFGDLIFELWIYDESVGGFVYHQRYVDLKFNMVV